MSEVICTNAASSEPRGRCSADLEHYGMIMMPPNNAFASQALPSQALPSQALPFRSSASVLLTKGVTRLEGTLKLTTAILALAAGVYTFLGVRELLNGSPGMVLFAALIYSVAVSVGIYAFWVFLMHFMPHVTFRSGRGLMFGCLLLGSLDDRRDVVMAQRLGARGRRRDPAASRHHCTRLYPRSRYCQHQRHRGPGIVAGYSAGVVALRK